MPKVSLDKPAPDFTLKDFQGEEIHLSDFKAHVNILLVFNRGFM